MARKLWIVLIEDFNRMYTCDLWRRRYFPHEKASEELISVFTNQQEANAYAQETASRNPGFDIQVFEATHGFTAPPRPVEQKIWKDGNYVPA